MTSLPPKHRHILEAIIRRSIIAKQIGVKIADGSDPASA